MDEQQINRWANRALENLYGGWVSLTEHQLLLIIEATGGLDGDVIAEREALRASLGERPWSDLYARMQHRAERLGRMGDDTSPSQEAADDDYRCLCGHRWSSHKPHRQTGQIECRVLIFAGRGRIDSCDCTLFRVAAPPSVREAKPMDEPAASGAMSGAGEVER